jgi:hypothetical protein
MTIGTFAYAAGSLKHILLVIAIISLVLSFLYRDTRPPHGRQYLKVHKPTGLVFVRPCQSVINTIEPAMTVKPILNSNAFLSLRNGFYKDCSANCAILKGSILPCMVKGITGLTAAG